MYKGEGTIRFTRIHSNQDLERPVEVEIADAVSGDVITVVRMSEAEFGAALSAPSTTQCEVRVYTEAHLGMRYETKGEDIPWKAVRGTPEERRKAVEPFEVDGWLARLGDFENPHNWGKGTCHVMFSRYVNVEEKEVEVAHG